MHDDLFVIVREIVTGIPQVVLLAIFLILLSMVLTWMKWHADIRAEEERRKEENPKMPVLCGFPLCGKNLDSIPKDQWEMSKSCEIEYCSVACRKRDWHENNHHSIAILLKRRAQELALHQEHDQRSKEVQWYQQLYDLIPNPQGAYTLDIGTVFDNVSRQVEMDAAKLTARTFCSAYMKKFGLAVHMWAHECFGCCGRGCVLVHLSEKAMQDSSGAPISFVQRRTLLPLQDFALNKLVREYDPSSQVVLYILQRGLERRQLAYPICYTVYGKDKPKEGGKEGAKPKAAQRGGSAPGKADKAKKES